MLVGGSLQIRSKYTVIPKRVQETILKLIIERQADSGWYNLNHIKRQLSRAKVQRLNRDDDSNNYVINNIDLLGSFVQETTRPRDDIKRGVNKR